MFVYSAVTFIVHGVSNVCCCENVIVVSDSVTYFCQFHIFVKQN